MTTEERIAELEETLNNLLPSANPEVHWCLQAIACEIRALRLMLRDEIREAMWPKQKGPHPDDPSGDMPRWAWTDKGWRICAWTGEKWEPVPKW